MEKYILKQMMMSYFGDSIGYFEASGFKIIAKTYDLDKDSIFEDILTEHEIMFKQQGIKIKALIAQKI